MGNLGERLRRTIQSIEDTTVCFYQNNEKEGYRRLGDTLQGLDEVIGEAELIGRDGEVFILDGDRVLEHLKEAVEALEQKDTLLLADILQYEITPLLEEGYERYHSETGH